MKKIILATALILISTAAQAAGVGPNGVPIHSMFDVSGSGDLSSTTRHSFVTGQVLNPKTTAENNHNAALNYANGYFLTGSQVWKNTGTYNFFMPSGFSKLLIVGCGAGGFGETQTGLSSVAATGGGGSGNCYRVIVTKEAGSLVTFYVPAAGDIYNTQLNSPFDYIRRDLGLNGGKGGLPSWNNGWVDAPGAPGAGTQFQGWVTGNGQINEKMANGAELIISSVNANGYLGGVSEKKIFSSGFSKECHPGRGGDGIPVGNGKVPVAAENGCVMILW